MTNSPLGLDRIELTGLRATGFHGVLATERATGQEFVVDLVLYLDTRPAAAGDDLAATIDYGDIADRVVAVIAAEPVDLIETLAERIAAGVIEAGARRVDVRVHKPAAPLAVEFADVAVSISRDDGAHRPVVDPIRAIPAQPAEGGTAVQQAAGPDSEPEPSDLAPSDPEPAVADVPPTVVGIPGVGAGASRLVPASPVDAPPAEAVLAVVGLGANLGDPAATLGQAVTELGELPNTELVGVSPLARTAAVGGPDQPDYLNAVVTLRTRLGARALLHELQRIEGGHGRVRVERWAARTLDLDLIAYDDVRFSDDELTLPHPRAAERAFVLEPWSHLDPDAELPAGRVADLARTAADRTGIRWLALDWLKPRE